MVVHHTFDGKKPPIYGDFGDGLLWIYPLVN